MVLILADMSVWFVSVDQKLGVEGGCNASLFVLVCLSTRHKLESFGKREVFPQDWSMDTCIVPFLD